MFGYSPGSELARLRAARSGKKASGSIYSDRSEHIQTHTSSKKGTLTMTSRRDFLNLAIKGSALTAAAALMPEGASVARDASKDGTIEGAQSANSSSQGHYKPPFKLAMAALPLGTQFSVD